MTELKIDNENMDELAANCLSITKEIVRDARALRDKEDDRFDRYMAMHKLAIFYATWKHTVYMLKHVFRAGFDLHHPELQTKKAIEHGWDKINIRHNPFFVQDDEKEGHTIEVSSKDMPDELREAIADFFKSLHNKDK